MRAPTNRFRSGNSPACANIPTSPSSAVITDNQDLWNWYKNIVNGIEDRRNGAIVLQDEEHNDVLRWQFENGWICKWEGPSMNATSNDVAIENIEICHEGVALV